MPRKTDSNNPAHWLEIAASDLAGVKVLVEQRLGFSMCQSKLAEILEKILKAELIRVGWVLEKTHDLERLRKEIRSRDAELGNRLESLCINLAEVYFTGRYPGFDLEDENWPLLKEQLDQVGEVFGTVRARIAPK